MWDRRFEHGPHLDLILQEVHCELLQISGSESGDPPRLSFHAAVKIEGLLCCDTCPIGSSC